jgi:hypothetical protein
MRGKNKGLVTQYETGLIDFYGRMKALNDAQQKENPAYTLVGPDRIHPGPLGQFVMAYAYLRDQNMPAYVSRISIDAAQGRTNGCVNCAVSALKATTDSVAFSCLENALPFPVADSAKGALKLVPIIGPSSREELTPGQTAQRRWKSFAG